MKRAAIRWPTHQDGVMANQSFEWPRLLVWVTVCAIMIPAGGLIGLALVVFMILALAEFMPTL